MPDFYGSAAKKIYLVLGLRASGGLKPMTLQLFFCDKNLLRAVEKRQSDLWLKGEGLLQRIYYF